MGELDLLRALDFGLVDSVQGQQLVEQQPRSGIVVAIDEARLALDQILQRRDLERIAALDHQPHLARDETDDAILARIEPFLAGRMPCARNSPRGRCTPERSQAPCASETSEFWLLT